MYQSADRNYQNLLRKKKVFTLMFNVYDLFIEIKTEEYIV